MNAKIHCTMVVFCHDEWWEYSAEALLARLLARMQRVLFVDNFVLCTNVDRLALMAAATGFHHVPLGLPARRDVDLPPMFRKSLSIELNRLLGSVSNIQLSVDAAYPLVRTETVESMFDQLMEEVSCHEVALGNVIDPHLYVKMGDALHQIYDHAGVDRQKMPALFRRAGISIRHGLRPQLGPKVMQILPVPWCEVMLYNPQYHDFFEEQSAAMEVRS
jgi:hypothetical protein